MSLAIVIFTMAISIAGIFSWRTISGLSLEPGHVKFYRQWYRLFTYALVHQGWSHLGLNMATLLMIGYALEQLHGPLFIATLYVTACLVCAVPFMVNRRWTIGASGPVAAVIFAWIQHDPFALTYFWPVQIPAVVFGVIYLLIEFFSPRYSIIAHDAHFWGAIYGFTFAMIWN